MRKDEQQGRAIIAALALLMWSIEHPKEAEILFSKVGQRMAKIVETLDPEQVR